MHAEAAELKLIMVYGVGKGKQFTISMPGVALNPELFHQRLTLLKGKSRFGLMPNGFPLVEEKKNVPMGGGHIYVSSIPIQCQDAG